MGPLGEKRRACSLARLHRYMFAFEVHFFLAVLRQNLIRVECSVILFCDARDREPAINRELLPGPWRFLLGGSKCACGAYIHILRISERQPGSGSPIVTVMQPTESLLRLDSTRSLGGQVKTGQLGSLQNRPTVWPRT